MKYSCLFFAVIAQIFCMALSVADGYNPKPYDGDLVLPMPNNGSMVFRPVFIGEGHSPFAFKGFNVGDKPDNFKEFPTYVMLGGSFKKTASNGRQGWLYYIGKYEVAVAQYDRIMKPGSKSDSQLPINNISWFDVQEFVNKYNLWLFENAKDKLPKNGEALGFLRLPTEIEWEFAARGGIETDDKDFFNSVPYAKRISKYEWFYAPGSSSKPKKIGILEPNPLKIHDMLGNISEMTSSFYRIEYYQGRTGGFVARGGNFTTSKKTMRSSLRSEIPFYRNLKSNRQLTLGFRLVISSQIFDSRKTVKVYENAWDDYRKKDRQVASRPDPSPPKPTVVTNVELDEAMKSLEILKTELKNASQTVKAQLNTIGKSFIDIESMVQNSEFKHAYAFVKIASEDVFLLYTRDILEIPGKQKALKLAEDMGKSALIDKIKRQIKDKKENIESGLSKIYGDYFKLLETKKQATVEGVFENYIAELLSQSDTSLQIRITKMVKEYFQEYAKTKRFNIEKWRDDLENL